MPDRADRADRAGVLDAILAAKRAEIAALSEAPPVAESDASGRREAVMRALDRSAGAPLRLIAEIKRKSPSAGALSTALSVPARALAYAEGGASMISVLCDKTFFDGGFEHLTEARRALDGSDESGRAVPLLAKEFVLDERQIARAAACGADAVLLIARIVSPERLGELFAFATSRGLEPLVEVVTEGEIRAALDAGARLVGVNARDLDTLRIDPAHAARLLAAIPEDRIALHLSGVRTPEDVAALAASGIDGALIGEALMRLDDPRPLLRQLVAAAAAS
jgi:indole-3-glycerol phosphate synthase